MASTSGPAHRSVANIRPQPTVNQSTPGSPHTPLRTASSAYGSPSALRAEEDCVVIELGTRYLRAGFAGEAVPKAAIGFGPEEQRRPGDYRRWHTDYEKDWRQRIQGGEWGKGNELWQLDLRGVDLGLVRDKIERAVREAFTKYLLIDSRPRRMVLALPSTLPLPLLSTVLDSLFTNFQPPNISLMSSPALTTVAAGLRSALIVDIGWTETIITGVYEFREVLSKRSIRAAKLHGEEMFKMLVDAISPGLRKTDTEENEAVEKMRQVISFEECEDIIARMAWCKGLKTDGAKPIARGLTPVVEEDELRSSIRSLNLTGGTETDSVAAIPLRTTTPSRTLHIPFSRLAEPCETAFLASGQPFQEFDDEELPLHLLVYQSLLYLPVDIRSMCMARIVFVGGGSKILGLKERILDEVAALVDNFGWSPVRGKAVDQLRLNPKMQNRQRQAGYDPMGIKTSLRTQSEDSTEEAVPTALLEQEADPIDAQLQQQASKGTKPLESGYLRAVDSLGAWSGASLLSQLKIPAVSVIDRDQWLTYGASGASKELDISANITTKRQSLGGAAAFKSGAAERSSWTLGLWA